MRNDEKKQFAMLLSCYSLLVILLKMTSFNDKLLFELYQIFSDVTMF